MINTKRKTFVIPEGQQEARDEEGRATGELIPTAEVINEVLGAEMLTEAIEDVSLDRYLDRSPKLGEPINYPEMVGVLQRKRQMFITAEAKRKSGIKDEGEENVEVTV